MKAYSKDDLISNIDHIKKVFFFRISGTGMGAAATLLKESGFDISGCDMSFDPPMGDYLKQAGIPCYDIDKVDCSFLKQYDLIVVGNSVANPNKGEAGRYARLIEEAEVPFASFPTVLGALLLRHRDVVGIAGTHGKTTTTYLALQLFRNLGMNPGYFIGGVLNDAPPSALGEGLFFIESDEYDSAYFEKFSKFRSYELNHMILTSLEFDHADIFENLEQIESEFTAVLPHLSGQVIACHQYESVNRLHKQCGEHKDWFLYGEDGPIGPRNIISGEKGSSFELSLWGDWHRFDTNLIGIHNVLNLASCLIFAYTQGISVDRLQQAVKDLKLVRRRQEFRGYYKGALVIDDFAHHPRAVSVTLDSLRKTYGDRRMIVVMDPVSATARSNLFQKEFAESLSEADSFILAKPYLKTTAKNFGDMDADLLIQDVSRLFEIPACTAETLEELRDAIDRQIKEDDLLVILSNRTCLGLWNSDFVKEIKK